MNQKGLHVRPGVVETVRATLESEWNRDKTKKQFKNNCLDTRRIRILGLQSLVRFKLVSTPMG